MKDKLNGCGPLSNGCCSYPATGAADDVDDVGLAAAANGFSNGIGNKAKLHGGKANNHCDTTTHRRHINNNEGHVHSLGPDDSEVDDTVDVGVPTRTQVLKDPANLCTFAGAILAMLAFASMWNGRYYLGMFLNVAASVADIVDGPIARSTPNRHPAFSIVGCKLDCYSDLVSHFVVPASLLMHLGDMSPWCIILAALYVCAGIMRQSYFEVTGRCDEGRCIFGVTSDYMVAIYSVPMHLLPLIGAQCMVYVLALCFVLMIFCSLTFSLRSRRYEGFGLLTVTVFNILLCLSCAVLALVDDTSSVSFVIVALPVLLLTAYPGYFRFVEFNH